MGAFETVLTGPEPASSSELHCFGVAGIVLWESEAQEMVKTVYSWRNTAAHIPMSFWLTIPRRDDRFSTGRAWRLVEEETQKQNLRGKKYQHIWENKGLSVSGG